jgi:hypothetical protein
MSNLGHETRITSWKAYRNKLCNSIFNQPNIKDEIFLKKLIKKKNIKQSLELIDHTCDPGNKTKTIL